METHEEADPSTGSHQGRRLACERCRGQKLKCEKSNVQGCCRRCKKADVQCSFELALPPGRRPRATNPAAQSAKSKWAAATVALATELETDASHMDTSSDPTGLVQSYHVGQGPASSDTLFDDTDSIMEMLGSDNPIALAAALEASFGEQVAAAWSAEWAAAGAGTGGSWKTTTSPWDALAALDGPDHAMAAAAANEGSFMTVEFAPPVPRARPGSSSPSSPRDPDLQHQLPQPGTPPSCILMPASESRAADLEPQPPATKGGGLAALVRRAAELGDNMYELRLRYHDGHSELDPPGHFPVHMSGEVLQAADDFLSLLGCFLTDEPTLPRAAAHYCPGPSSLTPTPTPTFGPNHPPLPPPLPSSSCACTASSSLMIPDGCGPIASSDSEPAAPPTSPPPPPQQGQHRRPAVPATVPGIPADQPAALTLLATHRRLLDLYLLYYQAVYAHVRATAPARRRWAQPIWRDLRVGAAPLQRGFGDLHARLVVQAAARVLEDVEGALGLAEGCCVGGGGSGPWRAAVVGERRGAVDGRQGSGSGPGWCQGVGVGGCRGGGGGRDGGHGGVLGNVVTARFVEQCIAEGTAAGGGGGAEQGQGQGPGVVARIREVVAGLAAVLDGPAALHRL